MLANKVPIVSPRLRHRSQAKQQLCIVLMRLEFVILPVPRNQKVADATSWNVAYKSKNDPMTPRHSMRSEEGWYEQWRKSY